MKPILASLLLPAVFISLAPLAFSGPLQQAAINQIVNDVKVIDPAKGARPAAVRDIIRDDLAVRTGIQSRTELLFQDDTLTRLGAETVFSFKAGTRDLQLDRGTMLLQVPKNHGGARIRTASVTASITGTTILMEYLPSKSLKVVVLEGSLRLSPNGRLGEAINLTAGRMIIMDPNAKRIPEPVKVDLRKLVNTSSLINPVAFKGNSQATPAVLPSLALIEKEIAIQDKLVQGKDLAGTNLVIAGSGTEVVIASEEKLAQLDQAVAFDKGSVTTANGQLEAVMPTRLAKTGEPAVMVKNETALPTGGGRGTISSSEPTDSVPVVEAAPAVDIGTAGQTFLGTDTTRLISTANTGTATATIIATGNTQTGNNQTGTGTGSGIPSPAFIAIPDPYVISNNTTIKTAARTIDTNGTVAAGGLFQSVATDGSPSAYLFDTPTAFDTGSRIDSKFGTMTGNGIFVFRFAGLDIQKAPAISCFGGPIDLAFVSQSGITSNASGSAWTLDGLRSLFLGTVNGPITVAKEFRTSSSGSSFKHLQFYARGGSGTVTLDNKISLPFAAIFVDAEQGIVVSNGAEITALGMALKTPGSIVMDASPATRDLKLTAGNTIRLTKSLANANIEMSARTLQTTSHLIAVGGFLNIGPGGIQAGNATLGGFNRIETPANVRAGSLNATNSINIGGTFTTGASNGTASLSAPTIAVGGGVDLTAANFSTFTPAGGELTVNATDVSVSPTGLNGIQADGADGLLFLIGGGNGGTVNIGSTARPVTNSITVDRPITATTGANGTGIFTGGNGGTVSLVAKGTIAVNSTIKVSDRALARASRTGGNITLHSLKTSGTAVSISNTGQLVSLLSGLATGAGGKIEFISSGGDILVNGGTVQADRGSVGIRNNGDGNVALNNANVRGDVVKVGALGANGQLLIGGGTINADTTLNLYGGTSNGQVRFTGNTTLSGSATKNIAGKSVTIDDGRTVTIGGRGARVFTDAANYTGSGGNGSTSGAFAGSGATTQPFSARPGF